MKIAQFPVIKTERLTLTDLVSKANEVKLEDVAILGVTEDGSSYIFSNYTSYPELLYLLRVIENRILEKSQE